MDSIMNNMNRRAMKGGGGMPEYLEDPTIMYDVPFVVEAEMGRTRKTVREMLKMTKGSLIELDKDDGAAMELRINGHLIAKGEVVEVDGNYAIRILELCY